MYEFGDTYRHVREGSIAMVVAQLRDNHPYCWVIWLVGWGDGEEKYATGNTILWQIGFDPSNWERYA